MTPGKGRVRRTGTRAGEGPGLEGERRELERGKGRRERVATARWWEEEEEEGDDGMASSRPRAGAPDLNAS